MIAIIWSERTTDVAVVEALKLSLLHVNTQR